MTWTMARRAAGAGWSEVAYELGVSAVTLKRWLAARSVPTDQATLRPVVVSDASAPQTLTLVAPSGLRIEGVSLADVIAILGGVA